jgi:hypothetical protein
MTTRTISAARWRRRALAAIGGAVLLVCLLAGPAMAGPYVDRAASALRNDPVYVNSAARSLSPASADALRNQVKSAGTPIFIAVLPAAALKEARNDPNRLAAAIAAKLGRDGTVGVAAGSRTGADSTTLDPATARAAMRAASGAHRGNLSATLTDFVDLTSQAAAGERPIWQSLWERPVVKVAVLALGLILIALAIMSYSGTLRRRPQSRTAGFADVQALAYEDITALDGELRELEAGLEAAGDNPPGQRDYQRAKESLDQAKLAYDQAHVADDFAPVSTAVEAGRYFMTLARARLEGREAIQRRPPCFFDTRHGPSVDDVGWIPVTGPPRPVPACEACMRSVAGGVEPVARQVVAGGRRMAFYNAPPHFESWFAGYFGGAAASLVDGFPLGRALDDGYVGGLNTFGGGYGYLPVSFADTGLLDPGGGDIGTGLSGADTELLVRPAGHDVDSGEE